MCPNKTDFPKLSQKRRMFVKKDEMGASQLVTALSDALVKLQPKVPGQSPIEYSSL